MSKNTHYGDLPNILEEYAENRSLDYQRYSKYHMRIMDGGYCVLDAWTTGRYYALTTDYHAMNPNIRIVERGGEKGNLPLTGHPTNDYEAVSDWLDSFFFAPVSK